MNLTILCVGKLKEDYWKAASAEYAKRLGRFGSLSVVELAESRSDDRTEESDAILKKLETLSADYVVALDVGGRRFSSEGFAEKLADLALEGKSRVVFIIGGSNGYDDRVRAKADLRLSFSDFTFPHQLMRVVLLEQIYRACKINAGEKYHK